MDFFFLLTWGCPFSRSPFDTLHNASVSWRGAFTHVWCPGFCSCSPREYPGPGARAPDWTPGHCSHRRLKHKLLFPRKRPACHSGCPVELWLRGLATFLFSSLSKYSTISKLIAPSLISKLHKVKITYSQFHDFSYSSHFLIDFNYYYIQY